MCGRKRCERATEEGGEGLAPQPSPTSKPLAIPEVEIRDALWQVLDIP